MEQKEQETTRAEQKELKTPKAEQTEQETIRAKQKEQETPRSLPGLLELMEGGACVESWAQTTEVMA